MKLLSNDISDNLEFLENNYIELFNHFKNLKNKIYYKLIKEILKKIHFF